MEKRWCHLNDAKVMDFATRIKEFERELTITNDYRTLRGKITSLRGELGALAPSLTLYEKEHFSNDIESILQSVHAKLSKSKDKKRLFSFKQKTLPETVKEKAAQAELVNRKETITAVGENYVLERGNSAFENLESCTFASATNPSNANVDSGSLSFHNITKSVINLQRIYFQRGSIFMTDCGDSIVFFRLPPKGDIQIRLRNLQNCKIQIEKLCSDSDCKQVVIIENCHNCIFSASTRDHLVIQDFSDPFQSYGANTAFTFEDFDICDNDTMRLLQTYL